MQPDTEAAFRALVGTCANLLTRALSQLDRYTKVRQRASFSPRMLVAGADRKFTFLLNWWVTASGNREPHCFCCHSSRFRQWTVCGTSCRRSRATTHSLHPRRLQQGQISSHAARISGMHPAWMRTEPRLSGTACYRAYSLIGAVVSILTFFLAFGSCSLAITYGSASMLACFLRLRTPKAHTRYRYWLA